MAFLKFYKSYKRKILFLYLLNQCTINIFIPVRPWDSLKKKIKKQNFIISILNI